MAKLYQLIRIQLWLDEALKAVATPTDVTSLLLTQIDPNDSEFTTVGLADAIGEALREVEDENPALAAQLQDHLDILVAALTQLVQRHNQMVHRQSTQLWVVPPVRQHPATQLLLQQAWARSLQQDQDAYEQQRLSLEEALGDMLMLIDSE